MAQQEAPEVGAVIDGYRFKGGDPKQEASWEQTEPLPAPEYGQGAVRNRLRWWGLTLARGS